MTGQKLEKLFDKLIGFQYVTYGCFNEF